MADTTEVVTSKVKTFIDIDKFKKSNLIVKKIEKITKDDIFYGSASIEYKYGEGDNVVVAPLRINFPWVESSGIVCKPFVDKVTGKKTEKSQISFLATEEVAKKLTILRTEILTQIIASLDPKSPNYNEEIVTKFELDATNFPINKTKPFKQFFYENPKRKGNKRVYVGVRPYSNLHMPSKASSKGTKTIDHKIFTETNDKHFSLQTRPMAKFSHVYIGSNIKSIIWYLDQTLIKAWEPRVTASEQEEDVQDLLADMDEDEMSLPSYDEVTVNVSQPKTVEETTKKLASMDAMFGDEDE